MAHLGDASLEIDSDCDFLMDCDEGLREVLHLLCATPRPGLALAGPGSPRSHTPRRVAVPAAAQGSPPRSSVEESNLRYLSQFNDSSLNQVPRIPLRTTLTPHSCSMSSPPTPRPPLPSSTSAVWPSLRSPDEVTPSLFRAPRLPD